MKKHSPFIIKENGFILLHVLFVISILFILVTSGVASYRNELYITDRQIDQVKIESLFQMAQTKYKQDLSNSSEIILHTVYDFPEGQVDISVLTIEETYLKLHFIIKIHDSDEYYPLNPLLIYD